MFIGSGGEGSRYISSADSNQLVIMKEKENKRSGKRLTVKGCLDWDCR